jgi:alpha-methylacyl-CoA racemase
MNVYECSDGTYMSVAAAEPRFYSILLERLGLDEAELPSRLDRERWPDMKERFATIFRQRSRDEWCELFDGLDACVAPVLSPREAPAHPHNRARATFMEIDGVVQPSPAPRFARTPADVPSRPPVPGEHTREVLADLGLSEDMIDALEDEGVIATWAPATGSSAGAAL